MARATVTIHQTGSVDRSPISTRVEVTADRAQIGFWRGQGGLSKSRGEKIIQRHAHEAAQEVAALTREEMRRRTPRRTGRTQQSIHISRARAEGGLTGRYIIEVGSDSDVLRWLDEGTGIYGPRHRPITPVRGKVLKIPNRAGGHFTNRDVIRRPTQRSIFKTSLAAGPAGSKRQMAAASRAESKLYAYRPSVKGIQPMHILERTIRTIRPIAFARFRKAARDAAREIQGL